MNRLALGTAQFGSDYGIANQAGQVTRVAVKRILKVALSGGVDVLDTAIAYGDSEACLGEVNPRGFKLVTKLPPMNANCEDVNGWVREQVNASFSRLGVTGVYGLLLHRPEQLLGSKGIELYKVLQELQGNGQVQKIGVSIYSPAELDALMPHFSFDLVQAPFNLIDRRLYTSGWLHRLKDDGVEIHTRSAFLQGLLLMPQTEIPPKFLKWNNLWLTWHQWISGRKDKALQACLGFPLSFQEIDRVVVGAENESQLMQILSAANSQLNGDFPNLQCDEEMLINPANWNQL